MRLRSWILSALFAAAPLLAQAQAPAAAASKRSAAPAGPRVAPASNGTANPQQLGLAPAPMRLFMKITNADGSSPAGLATTDDPLYTGWGDFYSFSSSAEAPSNGVGGNGKPVLSVFTVDRDMDVTSVALLSRLTAGTASNFTFVAVRTTPDRIESWKVVCTGAYVAGLEINAAKGIGAAVERDSIAFTTIEWSYLDTDATGQVIADLYTSYNVALNKLTSGTRPPDYPGRWQTTYGLNLSNPADAAGDLDGDGQNNLQEYLAGTVPNDPKSVLRMTAVGRTTSDGASTVTLTWNSVPKKTYVVQSASAPGGPWTDVQTLVGAGTTTNTTIDATGRPTFFYRVIVRP